MAHEPKNIYYLALHGKGLPTPGLKRHSLWLKSPWLRILATTESYGQKQALCAGWGRRQSSEALLSGPWYYFLLSNFESYSIALSFNLLIGEVGEYNVLCLPRGGGGHGEMIYAQVLCKPWRPTQISSWVAAAAAVFHVQYYELLLLDPTKRHWDFSMKSKARIAPATSWFTSRQKPLLELLSI